MPKSMDQWTEVLRQLVSGVARDPNDNQWLLIKKIAWWRQETSLRLMLKPNIGTAYDSIWHR